MPGGDAATGIELTGAAPVPPMPRAALVTGGAQRVGRVLALALAEDGFSVAIHYHHSRSAGESLAEQICTNGGRAIAIAADLADEEAVTALLPCAESGLGPIGCLVNNAAVFSDDTDATATRESWDLHLAVNLRAPFVLMQNFAARLPENMSGVVVNLLDQRVWSLNALFRVLHLGQGRIVDANSDDGIGLGAAHSGQRNWTGPDTAEPAAVRRAIRAAVRVDAAAARHQSARDCRGNAVYPFGARDDRSDDRSRWRAASRLGAVAADAGDRVGARVVREQPVRWREAPPEVQRCFLIAGLAGA